MIDVNELRKGVIFELDGQLFRVIDYSHNKSGRGNASIRIKALSSGISGMGNSRNSVLEGPVLTAASTCSIVTSPCY